jgi:hypothetical protein
VFNDKIETAGKTLAIVSGSLVKGKVVRAQFFGVGFFSPG